MSGDVHQDDETKLKATVAIKAGQTVGLDAGSNYIGRLSPNDGIDIGNVTINNDAAGGAYVRPGTGANWTAAQTTASNLKMEPAGNVAHDAADSGNPLKIGAKAIDYAPDSVGEQGPAAVQANDRVNIATNLRGELVECVKAEYDILTALNITYNNVTTTATSANIPCHNSRHVSISYEITVASTPTLLTIEIEVSNDGTNWAKKMKDALGDLSYSPASIGAGIKEEWDFEISHQFIRGKIITTGTDANKTFTVANFTLYQRN